MKTMTFWAIIAIAALTADFSFARTFDFRSMGTKGADGDSPWTTNARAKSMRFGIKVGSASQIDDKGEMEIRAATVLKNSQDRQMGVNDIASFRFEPINVSKPLFFEVAAGVVGENATRNTGWQVIGCIIELWQNGKPVKHWSNVPGKGGKTALVSSTQCLSIDAEGMRFANDYDVFGNTTEIYAVSKDGNRIDIDEVLREFRPKQEADEAKDAPSTVAADDFVLKSFCGFVFGNPRPAFEQKAVRMQRPFRHYTIARPCYGANTGHLISVRLESRSVFENQKASNEALAGVASVFERKYGQTLCDTGSGYEFSNAHVWIRIKPNSIDVVNRDVDLKEQAAAQAIREAAKNRLKKAEANDGADVL